MSHVQVNASERIETHETEKKSAYPNKTFAFSCYRRSLNCIVSVIISCVGSRIN
ncbi:hypothetical protein BTTAP_60037 [Brochothrix thermosphacta]|nr:hypothetical protein BTTAP_60037 [Brochothrix thermosphacta]